MQTPAPQASQTPKSNGSKVVMILVLLIILAALGFFLFKSMDKDDANNNDDTAQNNSGTTPTPTPTQDNPEANLSLQTASTAVKVGDTFSVDMVLDTAGMPIDAVDIFSLHYDPKVLQVVDDNSAVAGVQITPGKILTANGPNMVDAKAGTIKLGQAAVGGTNYTGKGVLATIHFKALAAGNSDLKFDFALGNTIDTNAAYNGKDQLSSVSNLMINVSAK